MPLTARAMPVIGVGETRFVSVDYTDKLDSGESLTGTPTVAEQTTEDLTISNESVSNASLTINGRSVPSGAAVQFKILGQAAGTTYTVRVTVSTDATPAQTFVDDVKFSVV